ncbi:MAG: hypothetical protein NWF07_11095 [Candidatus Bathyarchaeota archaeon]|nr:hypothetical protein [Candidatus Bathyarchaeota archaeon]
MKKQYALGILLLIGMGIVTTLAFQYNTGLNVDSAVYSVSATGATGTVTKVKAIPKSGDLDQMKIMITMTGQTENFDIFITLQGADLTGVTPSTDVTVTTGTGGTHSVADGYLEYTACTALGASGVWTIEIDASSASALTATLWQDTTGLMITVVDA